MKAQIEERLKNWGFHEEDIPGILKIMPKIEDQEDILIVAAALRALMKLKVPNYKDNNNFIPHAKVISRGDKRDLDIIYNLKIPILTGIYPTLDSEKQ